MLPFHPAQAVGPAFGVEGVVADGAAGVPPEGPEEGREADDQKIERPQQAGLEAVPVLVQDHSVIRRRPEVNEVSQGNAPMHVPGTHHMNGRRQSGNA